jgi:serine/threonine protein kinase/uncharacterized membrane protein required for colicin V production
MAVREYVLQRVVGRGAMATVYLAQHSQTGKSYAIKFLAGEFALKEEFITRFLHEAEACALLDHENIMRVFSSGEDNGLHFMVLEYVDGVDLSHFLKVQDRVKESQALPWMKQCARALGYAHSRGIIHRDLKPENIMVTKEGAVKIADLGLSKNLGAEQEMSMTMSGTVIGTPYYIPPEQARDAKRVDPRADIYSLGATFYHLLTGRPPFEGNSAAEVMANHMNKALVNPQRLNHTLSDGMCDLISKMMEKDASNRFQTMEDLIQAIERVERGEAAIIGKIKLKSRTESQALEAEKRSAIREIVRNRWPILGVGVLAFIVMLYLTFFSHKPTTVVPPPPPANVVTGAVSTVIPPVSDTNAPPSNVQTNTPVATVTPTPKPDENNPFSELNGDISPKVRLSPSSFNWIDGFALVFVILGIFAAQQVGVIWGTIRAAAFWVALNILFRVLEPVNAWLSVDIKVPQPGAGTIALIFLCIVFLLPAWVLTHRLRLYDRNSVQKRLERTIAIVPGIFVGLAFAAVVMTFLFIVNPVDFPVGNSRLGAWVKDQYPIVTQINPVKPGR